MTYQHVSFIKKAMDGVIKQESDFPIEIVVGDDFSTDGTLDVIRSYQDTNKIKIKILERRIGDDYWKKRQERGRLYNFVNILENCRGKYIALLDGDDYWTDCRKLQKQVDFMEAHLDYSMCFHQANILDKDGSLKLYNSLDSNSTFHFHDFVNKNFVSTASCLYRNFHAPLPEWFVKLKAGDWGLHLLNAERGHIYYMNDCMSVYRMHREGLWSRLSKNELALRHIANFEILDHGFNYKYHKHFESAIFDRLKKISSLKTQEGFIRALKRKMVSILMTPFRG